VFCPPLEELRLKLTRGNFLVDRVSSGSRIDRFSWSEFSMLKGPTVRTAFSLVLLITDTRFAAAHEQPPQEQAGVRLDRILKEWELRSAARTGLDVRFKGVETSPNWGVVPFSGRIILVEKGRVLYEIVKHDRPGGGGRAERILWTNGVIHGINVERKEHIICRSPTRIRDVCRQFSRYRTSGV
jgi:hypothetical protein